MAFNKRGLDPTSSGSRGLGTIGTYETTDGRNAITTAGYFDSAYQEMEPIKAMLCITVNGTFWTKVAVDMAAKSVSLSAFDPHP